MPISSAAADALCIALPTFFMADSSTYTFFGDVGKACGSAWHFSNLNFKSPRSPAISQFVLGSVRPSRMGKQISQGMGFHVPDFDDIVSVNSNRGADYAANTDLMCKSAPRWSMWSKVSELNCIPIFNPPLQRRGSPQHQTHRRRAQQDDV